MIRRCAGCGSFFDAEECPNDHTQIPVFIPPPVVTSEVKRCVGCGAFFTEEKCPHDHSHIPDWQPPPQQAPYIGTTVRFSWPSTGEKVVGLITSSPDESGEVGIMTLGENVRISIEDIERI